MRSLICSILLLPGLAVSAAAQNSRPQFRPAVLPSGAASLVNRIDTKALLSAGQKNGALQFCAVISPTGEATSSWVYHAMPDSAGLQKEVEKCLTDAKFAPALYNHQPVGVYLFGTVVFDREAQPHLHIFLNQDPTELKSANDFIAPQPVIGADSKFTGLHIPQDVPVAVTGVVEAVFKVDAKGNLQNLRITGEDPPLLGFRDAVAADFEGAKFIPAFRNGDAAESEAIQPICYKPVVMEGEGE